MYFVSFPVAGTNIFPHANSSYGGQNLTEYNLRAREMVGTHPSIKYEVGPSYAHSEDDFEIRIQQDETGYIVTHSSLEVLPGRAVINGHYVQTLTPMIVDMLEANATLKSQSKSPLKGELEIGIRAFYSTEPTLAGTLLVDNETQMYLGVQLVVLPKGELVTPVDSPTDRNKVNCHLKLGSFTYLDGTIKSVNNYSTEKCQYIQADRIQNIDMLLSDQYLRKSRLNPKRLYTFSGKGTDPNSGYDTWCDSTDSLIIWDKSPQRTLTKPSEGQASFGTDASGHIVLAVPHKQVDGMVDEKGNKEYYKTRNIQLPIANYEKNTSGTVDASYTSHIKTLYNKMNMFHQIVKGKQVHYMEILDDNNPLPTLNQAWEVGDYVLVNQDYTLDIAADAVRAPSSMYVVLPGIVSEVTYLTCVGNSTDIPSSLTGVELGIVEWDDREDPNTTDPELYPIFFTEDDEVRGRKDIDYFVVRQIVDQKNYKMYYYKVTKSGKKAYSQGVLVTGEIPFAQEDVIGGFLNVPEDSLDGGYVYRDENGFLRLLDYNLLRTGVLAYQLGEDQYLESGLTVDEIQAYLDEYVNERVAFPTAEHSYSSSHPNIVDIDIYLPETEEESEINIYNIDSRFNTAVRVNLLGEANSTLTVNFINCEKLIISNDIAGKPIINVQRSCLYYDASLFNYIRTCTERASGVTGFSDLKIWYEMLDATDPNLVVDGLTVSELDAPIIAEDLDFWNETAVNDNHYRFALHSITFSGVGDIVKCSLLVGNETTANIEPGHHIMSSTFELPQGSGLVYPKSCVTKQLKITGSFVSCYKSDVWVVTDTMFTALSNTYSQYDMSEVLTGNIAFHANTNLISSNVDVGEGVECIPGWEPDTYHLFEGGVLS